MKTFFKRKTIKCITLLVLCFMLVTIGSSNELYSNDQNSIEIEKEWETNISTIYSPMSIVNTSENVFYINYFDRLISVDSINGKILQEYIPGNNERILDFLIENSFFYLSIVKEDENCNSISFLEKIDINSNKVIWKKELPFGDYFFFYTLSDTLLIGGSNFYKISKDDGKIVRDYFRTFMNAELKLLLYSSFSMKDETIYWYVSGWNDILRVDLPTLTLLKDKTHLEKELNNKPFEPSHLYGIDEDNNFIILSDQSILVVTDEGKIKKEITPVDCFPNSYLNVVSVNSDDNESTNPLIYKNYVLLKYKNDIRLVNTKSGEIYRNNTDDIDGLELNYDITYPVFFRDKLFLLDFIDNKARISIMSVPDLTTLCYQFESIAKFREPSVGATYFSPYLSFKFIEEENSLKLMVVYPGNVCLYKINLEGEN